MNGPQVYQVVEGPEGYHLVHYSYPRMSGFVGYTVVPPVLEAVLTSVPLTAKPVMERFLLHVPHTSIFLSIETPEE